jgi:hypothetical protein
MPSFEAFHENNAETLRAYIIFRRTRLICWKLFYNWVMLTEIQISKAIQNGAPNNRVVIL